MMIGTDVRNMTAIMNELILNKDAVFINQDPSPPARNGSGAWYRAGEEICGRHPRSYAVESENERRLERLVGTDRSATAASR